MSKPLKTARKAETAVVDGPGQTKLINIANVKPPEPSHREITARLKRSGLDPRKMLDFAKRQKRWGYPRNLRYFIMVATFVLFVAVPSAVVSVYMIFFASDQYQSSASFAVRNSSSTGGATDLLGLVMQSGADTTVSNSYILNDYLQSQPFLEDVMNNFDMDRIYSSSDWDWWFRMGTDLPVEAKLKYWKSKIETKYDQASGIIVVDLIAFTPEDAQNIMAFIVQKSEDLINNLSESARRQSLKSAQESLATAEVRLRTVRRQLLTYRETAQEISPEDNAKLAFQMIGELESQITTKQTTLKTLDGYLDPKSPRMAMLRQEIKGLQKQLDTERQRLGGGANAPAAAADSSTDNSIPYRIGSYSDLELEKQFAEEYYTTALAGLEKAKAEAAARELYLATFIPPTLPQYAQYPKRFIYIICTFLLLAGIWLFGALTFYNIRDRT
ncbi:RkpR, polysaccharide export protein [uncultured Roseibium sp.]|uniref:RkpR, polysaccharide export protein n=1 Tax=uncultured Roseibium sp. TaxID=1936171 RepID=UPI0032165536